MSYGTKEELTAELETARWRFARIKRTSQFAPAMGFLIALMGMALTLNVAAFFNFLIIPVVSFLFLQFYAIKVVEIAKYDVDRAEITLRYAR